MSLLDREWDPRFASFFLRNHDSAGCTPTSFSPPPVIASQAMAHVPVVAVFVSEAGLESSASIPGSAIWRRNKARVCVNQQMAYCAQERVSTSAGAWTGSLFWHMVGTEAPTTISSRPHVACMQTTLSSACAWLEAWNLTMWSVGSKKMKCMRKVSYDKIPSHSYAAWLLNGGGTDDCIKKDGIHRALNGYSKRLMGSWWPHHSAAQLELRRKITGVWAAQRCSFWHVRGQTRQVCVWRAGAVCEKDLKGG